MTPNRKTSAPAVRGVGLDPETRCRHYDGAHDVVAIKFFCCGTYYACYRCHRMLADHPAQQWPAARFDERAVRCGACGTRLSIRAYLDAGHACPQCEASFNPGCVRHRHRYFRAPDA